MKHLLAALTISLAAPVAAQDRMQAEDCIQSWDAMFQLTGLPAAQVQIDVDDAGWCVIEEGVFSVEQRSRVRLDSLKWRASAIDRLIDDGLPPRTLEIYGEGLGVLPQTGNRVNDYLFSLQNRGSELDFGLSVRWDSLQNSVFVDEGFIRFDADNRVDVIGRIDGIDLSDRASLQTSFGTMGLRNVTLKSTFDGWFEDYLAFPIGASVLDSADGAPENQVEALQEQAVAFLENVPETVLPAVAREALSKFIVSLPTPRGALQIQLNADPVIGAARLMPLGFAATAQDRAALIPDLMDGVRVLVTWTALRD